MLTVPAQYLADPKPTISYKEFCRTPANLLIYRDGKLAKNTSNGFGRRAFVAGVGFEPTTFGL